MIKYSFTLRSTIIKQTDPIITKLYELATAEMPIQITFSVTEKPTFYSVTTSFQREQYATLKNIPHALLTIPEQLLIGFLYTQPHDKNIFYVEKEFADRLFFYLNDLGFTKKPLTGKGKIELTYLLDISHNFCKLSIDLSAAGGKHLSEIDRQKLTTPENIFISFLSNVPLNNGFFFFNSKNISRLIYFLSKIKNKKDILTGENISISVSSFKPLLQVTKEGQKIKLRLCNKKNQIEIKPEQYVLFGDKEFSIFFKGIFYNLSRFNHELLSTFQDNPVIELEKKFFAEITAEIIPKLALREELSLEIDPALIKYQKTTITEEPLPRLEIKKNKSGSLLVKLFWNYGPNLSVLDQKEASFKFHTQQFNNQQYLLKRYPQKEEWLRELLKEKRFKETTLGYKINEDDFIDFYTYDLPGLMSSIKLSITGEDISEYFFNKGGDEFALKVDFKEGSSINWFEFKPTYNINNFKFSHDQLAALFKSNKRYLRLSDGSLAKLPTEKFNQLESLLKKGEFNKKKHSYTLQKNELYFLYHNFRHEAKAQLDRSLKELVKGLDNFQGIKKIPLPEKISGTPRNYQKSGYNWLLFLHQHGFNGILADDMGLGKTFQVLLLLLYLKEQKIKKEPSLIVVPTSVVYNWLAEIEKFTPTLKTLIISGGKKRVTKIKNIKEYDLIITSYALVRNDLEHYSKQSFHYVILDEAQYIKNHKSLTCKAVKCLRSKYRLALTGTPVENHLGELWSIFDFLMPGFLSSYSFFKVHYENNLDKLTLKIKPFILRRMKKDVISELPAKTEINSYCKLTAEQEELYLKILKTQKKELLSLIEEKGIGGAQINILSILLRLRQVCCHPQLLPGSSVKSSAKFELFKELLQTILDDGHKVVIFSQFVKMLAIIKKHLQKNDIPFVYLDGSTQNKKRQGLINEFNNNPEQKIFLCSLKAGGIGINLTAANYVIIYDPWWNPAVEQQAMDRVYRLGQKKDVFVYKLLARGSVEEKILTLQEQKKDLLKKVISKGGGIILSQEDINNLLTY